MKKRVLTSVVALALAAGLALMGGGTGANAAAGPGDRSGPPKCCP